MGSDVSPFLTWSDSPVNDDSSTFKSLLWIRMPSAGSKSPYFICNFKQSRHGHICMRRGKREAKWPGKCHQRRSRRQRFGCSRLPAERRICARPRCDSAVRGIVSPWYNHWRQLPRRRLWRISEWRGPRSIRATCLPCGSVHLLADNRQKSEKQTNKRSISTAAKPLKYRTR